MNARRVAKEYEANTRGLNKMLPSVPPTGSQEETKQVKGTELRAGLQLGTVSIKNIFLKKSRTKELSHKVMAN